MLKRYILLTILILSVFYLNAQDTINKKRLVSVASVYTVGTVGSLLFLNQAWYANYPQSNFHWYNDNNDWLQVDKCGHTVTSYQISRLSTDIFAWTGMSRQKSAIIISSVTFSYMLGLEILDGFSTQWGASWGDLIANTSGVGLFLAQELLWEEQRIALKYSFTPSKYPSMRPSVLGSNFAEQLIKDYNGTTFWLSVNPESFFKDDTFFPDWLNIAFGYGADGLTGGSTNALFGDNGLALDTYNRQRQFYLSLDIDFTRIPTNSAFLRSVFDVINIVKIPFPALEYATYNGMQFRWIQF